MKKTNNISIRIYGLLLNLYPRSYRIEYKKPMEQCLAEEIIKASENDLNSFAVSKKNEMERVAKSAR